MGNEMSENKQAKRNKVVLEKKEQKRLICAELREVYLRHGS